MASLAHRWTRVSARLLAGRSEEGLGTIRYLMVVTLVAMVFVLAFALFGDRVYEKFKDLAEQVANAT